MQTCSHLGTTPISTLPYVLSLIMPFTFGTITFAISLIYVFGQCIILNNYLDKKVLSQIPTTLMFSIFIDLSMHILSFTNIYKEYYLKILMLLIGIIIMAYGIFLEIKAGLSYASAEGLVKVISDKTNKNFGKIKVCFDVLLVISAICISFYFLHFLQGVREGTIFSAFLTGFFVRVFQKTEKWLKN